MEITERIIKHQIQRLHAILERREKWIGSYKLVSNYKGWALHRIVATGGIEGIETVFDYTTKKELSSNISAYVQGVIDGLQRRG